MALWSAAFLGMSPLASPIDGAIADAGGLRTAAIVMAVPALAAAVVVAVRLRARPASHQGALAATSGGERTRSEELPAEIEVETQL
jgi:hypothetical protein